MNILIHDLKPVRAEGLFPDWTERRGWMVFDDDGSLRNCVGCFACWVRTPGTCVLRDPYSDMGKCLARCQELVLVSRCVYGGLSPFVKGVVDRSISYILPDFTTIGGEMHHRPRYKNRIVLTALFYGTDLTEGEKATAEQAVRAMAVNLYCDVKRVEFRKDPAEWEGVQL